LVVKTQIAYLALGQNFDPSLGKGVQKYIYELYVHLRAITKDVKKVAPARGKYGFTLLELIYPFYKYDLIHMPCPIAFNPPLRKCPTITTLHELVVHDNSNEYLKINDKSNKFSFDIMGKFIRKQIFGSDYLMANSTQTFNEAITQGYPQDRIFLVHLAISDKFISKIQNKKSHKEFKVGYIGTHNKRKNVGFAVKALNLIEDPEVKFEIWGDGPESIYLKQLAQNRNIVFRGFAPEEKIVNIYDSFDAFVFPSYYEGFGLEILEAQARGLPVIIYKHAKIPKEVKKYCFEAESPEHMAQIIEQLKENGYSEKKRKEAMEYARSFTWEKTAKETLEVYKKILG